MRSLYASVLLLGLAASCSSPDSNTDTAITLDTLAAETSSTFCHSLFTCPVQGDTAGYRALFGDEATCRAGYLRLIGADFTDLVALARAGSVRFDGAAARRCVNAVNASCSLVMNDSSCAQTFTGSVALGGSCFRTEQCAGDAFCNHADATGSTTVCPGTCRARTALGAACTTTTECTRVGVTGEPSCEFDNATMASRCVDYRNTFTATAGQPCGALTTAGNVLTDARCQSGLMCDRTPPTPGMPTPDTGTCRAPIAVGAVCTTSGISCAGIARCVPSAAGGTAGTCTALTVVNTAGMACDDLHACNPLQRLACQSGTCQSVGTGGTGTPCSIDFGSLICNPGFYCQRGTTSDATCQPVVADGMACTTNAQCRSGSCGGSPMVCQTHVCQ